MASILISVVICTFNRAQLLGQSLKSTCDQTLEKSKYEVIVIDNGSGDTSRSVVEDLTARYPNVRYYFEPSVGLSYARNRGWKEARGRYVAYIDDDCKAPDGWLTTAENVIEEFGPEIFGGPYYPFYDSPKPVWFKDEYGASSFGDEAKFLESNRYLRGGNLFIRRDVLERSEGFNTELGMSGERVSYGEETDFINKARKENTEISVYYDPKLIVYHLVQSKKMRLPWLLKQRFLQGRYGYLTFSGGRHSLTVRHVIGLFGVPIVFLYECTFGIIFRDRNKYPYFQNYIYERIYYLVAVFGKLIERFYQTLSNKL
jgi:glycosyltransferase involved in cell wall biosynthesis